MKHVATVLLFFVIGASTVYSHEAFSTWNPGVWVPAPADYTLSPDMTLTFKVKACHSARVALVHIGRQLYQLDLGRIRDGVMEVTVYKQWPNIRKVIMARSQMALLDCRRFQSFWITWDDGIFEVGTGEIVGQEVVIRAVDPRPFIINHVMFSSGEGVHAYWLI